MTFLLYDEKLHIPSISCFLFISTNKRVNHIDFCILKFLKRWAAFLRSIITQNSRVVFVDTARTVTGAAIPQTCKNILINFVDG